jgi:hypothetical protein
MSWAQMALRLSVAVQASTAIYREPMPPLVRPESLARSEEEKEGERREDERFQSHTMVLQFNPNLSRTWLINTYSSIPYWLASISGCSIYL